MRPGDDRPLVGTRVIDFSWHGAGPYATRMLADHGADVIRIESSKRMDRLRILPPFRDGIKGENRSGYFADRNSNKRGIVLNLKEQRAIPLALDLIAQGDVVVNNFTPGTMTKLGLGYDAAALVKPNIIYLEMGTQGAFGPDSERPGYGHTVSSVTGLHHLSGDADRTPVGTGTNYPDHVVAPAHAAFAVLVALLHLRRTGHGQYIDLSQAETMVGLLGPSILDFTVNGRVQNRVGNLSSDGAPHGVYPCAGDDRWIALAARNQPEWIELCSELRLDAIVTDPRFSTLLHRHRNHADLDLAISAAAMTREPYELMTALQERGVPAGVVQDARDLLVNDPHLSARRHFAVLDHAEMGPSVYNSPPFKLHGVNSPIMQSPAPLLGEHTDEVLREVLGLDSERLAELKAEGVLA